MVEGLDKALEAAVQEYRETSKPVKKDFRESIKISIVGSVEEDADFRAEIKKNLLTLSESELNKAFMKFAPRMPNNDAYFQLVDLIKEICEEKGYSVDNVIKYGEYPDDAASALTDIEACDRELRINAVEQGGSSVARRLVWGKLI